MDDGYQSKLISGYWTNFEKFTITMDDGYKSKLIPKFQVCYLYLPQIDDVNATVPFREKSQFDSTQFMIHENNS